MKTRMIPLILFAVGSLLVVVSVIRGEASLALLLFIPIIYGGGWMLGVGILLIIASFLSMFFLSAKVDGVSRGESRYGGVVFIGPIPIVFGSDHKMANIMLYIGLAIAVWLFVFFLILW